MKKGKEKIEYSPFDDPIVSACFSDVETAGEAIRSLANSITLKDGIFITKIKSVTPQRYSKTPGKRGTRVDVLSKTETNQDIILEVNMYMDETIHQRNYFASSQLTTESSTANTTHPQMVDQMPYVIAINILNYKIRSDNDDWLQPVKVVYAKPPHLIALPQLTIYDIELPKFNEAKPDWKDDLYCWIYALMRAHEEHMTIKEVIKMIPEIQPFVAENKGFQQFCERYEFVATDESVRNEYLKWQRENMRQKGIVDGAKKEGKIEDAREMFAEGLGFDVIQRVTKLNPDALKKLQDEVEKEMNAGGKIKASIANASERKAGANAPKKTSQKPKKDEIDI